jgi:signal peptidase II
VPALLSGVEGGATIVRRIRPHHIQVLSLAAAIFLLDRVTKGLVATHMAIGQSIVLIPRVLDLTYILNSGAAFGVLAHRDLLFILVALLLLVGVLWVTFSRNELDRRLLWGLGLLAGGASGNLWDRMVAGQVIDFIHFRYWPVFNFADAAIVIGMGLVLVDFWRRENGEAVRDAGGDQPNTDDSRSG